jgi:hypothetical protein
MRGRHGAVDDALHVATLPPVCINRTVCAGVWTAKDAPLLTPVKVNAFLSSVTVESLAPKNRDASSLCLSSGRR